MWEVVAEKVRAAGGEVLMGRQAVGLRVEGDRIVAVEALNRDTGERETHAGDYVFSTMPVRDLVAALSEPAPEDVRAVSEGLVYRDFVTVGLLVRDLKIKDPSPDGPQRIRDNWIYIQEPEVLLGRLQVFNNWSPYLVADPRNVWLGLEYFCNETDYIWTCPEQEMIDLATKELARIDIIDQADVLDACVIRVPKTYPAYFGTYDRFDVIRRHVERYTNLFLVGRNGMHRYNNQDHSMLTAMVAVDNILANRADKSNIWAVNTEEEYHEEK
jgi:protoporphyrinogen oxidase